MPLLLEAPISLKESIDPQQLNDELIRVRKALYSDLGVPFPGIHLQFNESMEDGTYRISLNEIPMAEGALRTDCILVREDEENLKVLDIPYEKGDRFLPDMTALWVNKEQQQKLDQSGIRSLNIAQILTHHLSFILKKYAGDFLGLQETRYLLDSMEGQYPEIVKEVQRVLPVPKISEILQRLVQEEVSIRNLRTILQALIEWAPKEKDPVLLAEYVRGSLKRFISYKYSGGHNILPVYLLEASTEETIRKAIRQTSGGSFLAMDPMATKQFVDAVKENVGDLSKNPQKPALLTSMDVRRYVKKLIELEIPGLPVLSYQELTQEITIQPLAKVTA